MAVQVWIGERPDHANERRAIVALANGLDRLDELYLLVANFHVGGRTIDLIVIKHDALFIVELKHCDGKVFGELNGDWVLEDANGERKHMNSGRSNPYNQVISCYYSLTNFLQEQQHHILSDNKAQTVSFRSCRRLVVISPHIEEGSHIELDWKVECKGLDELPAFLITESSPDIELTEAEMVAIPMVLHCTQWHDVDQLLHGIHPAWQPEEAHDTTHQQTHITHATQQHTWQHTRIGRFALVMSVLALVLLIGISTYPYYTSHSQPVNSFISATSGPAGGIMGGGIQPTAHHCIWTGYQPVGKRWNTDTQSWLNVGVDSIVGGLAPQIVVTLEKVDYCGDEIVFFWSIRNNSNDVVALPLQSNNVTIRDPFGNEYEIADSRSQPRILSVKPGQSERGTMVFAGPVVQHAPSLLVRIKEKPFGEASWLVSLEGYN